MLAVASDVAAQEVRCGTKMLIASDLHFGANISEPLEEFVNHALDRARNADRLIVLAGDLTQNATEREYAQAEAFLRRLLGGGATIVLTPGNHDYGRWWGERLPLSLGGGEARLRFRALMEPILSQESVVAKRDVDSITVVGTHVFVALRSTHRGQKVKAGIGGSGRIRREQIAWARSELSQLDRTLKPHLVTHRSLWSDDAQDKHSSMVRRKRVEAELLKPFGFASFIHGHNHVFEKMVRPTPKIGYAIRHVSVPTLSERAGKVPVRGYVAWRAEEEPELIEV